MTAVLKRERTCRSQRSAIRLSILGPRPIMVAVDEGDSQIHGPVRGARCSPGLPLSGQRKKRAGMTGQLPARPHLVDEIRGKIARIVDSALHYFAKDSLRARSNHDGSNHRPSHGREDDIGERGAAPNAAAASIVIWIAGDDAGKSRTPSRGEREADRSADRFTNEEHTPKIQRVEKLLDDVGEISHGVLDTGRGGPAVAWKIGSHDLEARIQRPHQRHEVFELRAKSVQEQDRRTVPGTQEAQLAAEDTDTLRLQAVHVP